MKISDMISGNSSIEALAGSDEYVRNSWKHINLKVLLAIFSLADPPITQAKVAQLLEISPVTMSRIVSSGNHEIREEWIPVLSECLATVNMNLVRQTARSLGNVSSHIEICRNIANAFPIIENYLSKQPESYVCDMDYWGLKQGIIRFYNEEKKKQWLFSFGVDPETAQFRYRRSGSTQFGIYSMKSVHEEDRLSIIYLDEEWFLDAIRGWDRQLETPPRFVPRQHIAANYLSFILINEDKGVVEEEYVLPPLFLE